MSQRTPYTNFHYLNLDWVIKKIKTVFSPDNPPPYPVVSVNEMQGAVKLNAQNIPYVQGQPEMIWDEVNKRYIKPLSGIPGTDLAESYLEEPATPGTLGQVLTSDGQGNQTWQTPSAGGSVTDVQVNGVSVVNAGVANVPIAGNDLGVVKIESGYGITKNSAGRLYIASASDGAIKIGNSAFEPIVPSRQQVSVFYGLAKASGDTTQASSSNSVGNYTEDAKKKIRQMLGIQNNTWEKIGDYIVSEDTALFEITADSNGNPFQLSEILVKVWLKDSTTGNRDYISASNLVFNTQDQQASTSAPTKRYVTNTGSACYLQYNTIIKGGNSISEAIVATTPGSTTGIEQINTPGDNVKSIRGFRLAQYSSSNTLIPAQTTISVYGIRID